MASTTIQVGDEKDSKQPTDHIEDIGSKKSDLHVEVAESLDQDNEKKYVQPPSTARELVAEILMLEDDPTVNPWTFRMWFYRYRHVCFCRVRLLLPDLQRQKATLTRASRIVTTINSFKPQSVQIHLVFVAVITYIIGNAMALVLPSKGRIGRLLNPGPVRG